MSGTLRFGDGRFGALVCVLVGVLVLIACHPDSSRAGEDYAPGQLRWVGEDNWRSTGRATAAAAGITEVHIISPENLRGNLAVRTEPVDSVELDCRLTMGRIPSEEIALRVHETIGITITTEDNVATVIISTDDAPVWGGTNYSVAYECRLVVPPDCVIDADLRYFNLLLDGSYRDVTADAEYGMVSVRGGAEAVNVTGAYTEVDLRGVRGRIDVETSYASLSARDIVTSEPVMLRNEHGPISVVGFDGVLDARTSTGTIVLTRARLRAGGSALMSKHAPISFAIDEFEGAELYVETGSGHIDGKVPSELSARIVLEIGHGGRIETRGVPIRSASNDIGGNRLEGVCGDGDGLLEVTVTGAGGIDLRGRSSGSVFD